MKPRVLAASVLSVTLVLAGAASKKPPSADQTFAMMVTTGPAWDQAKPPGEQRHFSTHSANLARLKTAGVIVAGGRFGPYGLILLRAPDADSVRAMMSPDSSIAAGTFRIAIDRWSTIYEGSITR